MEIQTSNLHHIAQVFHYWTRLENFYVTLCFEIRPSLTSSVNWIEPYNFKPKPIYAIGPLANGENRETRARTCTQSKPGTAFMTTKWTNTPTSRTVHELGNPSGLLSMAYKIYLFRPNFFYLNIN